MAASKAPSRFEAAYVIPTKEQADRYRASNDQFGTTVLHEVELVDEEAPRHVGFLELTQWPQQFEFLDATRAMADAHWMGKGAGDLEIVTYSQLRVIQCLD